MVRKKENELYLVATNVDGKKANVKIVVESHHVSVVVRLDEANEGHIALRTASPGAAYGLADVGSFGQSANLAESQKKYAISHDGHGRRFLSSFVIFPQSRVASVFFADSLNHVDVGPDYFEMSVEETNAETFHFFVGEIPEIYSAYKQSRTEAGFPDVRPKRTFFELGWESWDALRWNTSSKSVMESIQSYLDNGYHIRWAVTGSGFWDKGGTTLSFGSYNKTKYPDADQNGVVDLRTWFENQGVAWLIGQRTNFVTPGGPHSSKPGESGSTLFETSPDTKEGVRNGFFLTKDGKLFQAKSTVFPTVPCYLLDGNQPGAAEWFESLYQGWNVDGVKEDTMMSIPDHTIYNNTMRKLAENGALVMARCGAYSSPGTLTRINDTHGPSSMTLRAPINYMQYAASAAPNVYSDTAGFGHMNQPVPAIRHAWLCSLTAGMSVGGGPWKWSKKEQRAFKKAIDFHYAIGPYLFSCAIDSYQSGYPYTLTPLPIAFPDDHNTYDLASKKKQQFQWMIGPSLLAAPFLRDSYKTSDKLDIYLPEGEWIDYETGEKYAGPTTLENYSMPLDKVPVFIGGKGVLVKRTENDDSLIALIYPIAKQRFDVPI